MLRTIALIPLCLALMAGALHAETKPIDIIKPLIKPGLKAMLTRVSWSQYNQIDGKPVPTVIYHITAGDGLSVFIAYSTVPTLNGQSRGIVASYFGKDLKLGGHNVAVAGTPAAPGLPPYEEFAPASLSLLASKATIFEQMVDILQEQHILNTVGLKLDVLEWNARMKAVTWTFRDVFRERELRDALVMSNLFQKVQTTPGIGVVGHVGYPVSCEKVFEGELP
jgi:hypothetical protein